MVLVAAAPETRLKRAHYSDWVACVPSKALITWQYWCSNVHREDDTRLRKVIPGSSKVDFFVARKNYRRLSVRRTPRSGCPLGRDALVPHLEQRNQHLAGCQQADEGVGRGLG